MDLRQFEHQSRNKFQEFEPSIDNDKMWDAIESQIPSEDNTDRRSFASWSLFLILGIMIAGIAYTLSSNIEQEQVSKNIEHEQLINSIEQQQGLNSLVQQQVQELSSNEQKQAQGLSSAEQVRKISNEQEQEASIEKVPEPVIGTKESTEVRIVHSDEQVVEYSQTIPASNRTLLTRSTDNIDAKSLSTNDVTEAHKVESDARRHGQNFVGFSSDVNASETAETVESFSLLPALSSILYGPEKEVPFLHLSTTKFRKEAVKRIENKKERVHFASVSASIMMASPSYFPYESSAYDKLVDLRRGAETPLETIDLRLSYGYYITKRFHIRTGLSFMQLTERSLHQFIIADTNFESVTIANIHGPNGSVTPVPAEVLVTRETMHTNERFNVHRSWNVPVLAAYALPLSKSLALEMAAGYEFNLAMSHTGFQLDLFPNLFGEEDYLTREYDISEDMDKHFLAKNSNRILVEGRLLYDLRNKLSVNAGFMYKHELAGLHVEEAPLRKKYNYLGLTAGLRYQF